MSSVHTAITGIQSQGGSSPPRLNILELAKDEKSFSLFIQALIAMQNTSQSQSTSHYGIGGIHGQPLKPWEGSGPVQSNPSYGYCHHSLNTFPTWHRPYVALFEQTLHQHATDIAQKYESSSTWVDLAQSLRLPYWDWAASPEVPSVLTDLQVTILSLPDGQRKRVKNPLVSYTFQGGKNGFPQLRGKLDVYKQTVRYPNPAQVSGATSNMEAFQRTFAENHSDLQSSLNKLFGVAPRMSWFAFANHLSTDLEESFGANSVEEIHDGVHVIVGGNGHMSDPAVAAFDPIFYLHHAQVDRVLALFQALAPNTWVTPYKNTETTLTEPINKIINETTPLKPFYSQTTGEKYWNSDAIKETSTFGYTYDDFTSDEDLGMRLERLYGEGADSIASFVKPPNARLFMAAAPLQKVMGQHAGKVNPASATGMAASKIATVKVTVASTSSDPDGNKNSDQQKLQTTVETNQPSNSSNLSSAAQALMQHPDQSPGVPFPTVQGPLPTPNGYVYKEWSARIQVRKDCLNESFAVKIYLTDTPTTAPGSDLDGEDYVGSHWTFVNSLAEHCENCQDQASVGALTEGYVSLTRKLLKKVGANQSDETVKKFIEEKLQWRVYACNVEEVPLSDSRLSSLKVTVVSQSVAVNTGTTGQTNGPPTVGSTFEVPHEHQGLSGRTAAKMGTGNA